MSHTNTTANYNLPQFVGTDKPSWLTDVNGAMTSIDTQMKANADANTTTAGDLTTLAGRVTAAEGNITTNTANITTVSNVASTAGTTATNAKNTADAIATMLDINDFGQTTATTSNGTSNFQNVYYASNSDGSVGKIYGEIGVTPSSNTATTITFSTPFRPSETLTIGGNVLLQHGTTRELYYTQYTIGTNGQVTIQLSKFFYNSLTKINLIATLTFFKAFAEN